MSKFVVKLQRAANWLQRHGIPGLPFLICLLLRLVFSFQVGSTTSIGRGTVVAYGGLGVVIHSRAVLGENCEIGASVVIGGNIGSIGVPELGRDVFVGPGAKILGDIRIGNGARIGANAVVLSDVGDNDVVVGIPARPVRRS